MRASVHPGNGVLGGRRDWLLRAQMYVHADASPCLLSVEYSSAASTGFVVIMLTLWTGPLPDCRMRPRRTLQQHILGASAETHGASVWLWQRRRGHGSFFHHVQLETATLGIRFIPNDITKESKGMLSSVLSFNSYSCLWANLRLRPGRERKQTQNFPFSVPMTDPSTR